MNAASCIAKADVEERHSVVLCARIFAREAQGDSLKRDFYDSKPPPLSV